MSIVVCTVKEREIILCCDSISVREYTQRKNTNPSTSKVIEVDGSKFMFGSVGYAAETILMKMFLEEHKPKDSSIDSFLNLLSFFSKWQYNKFNNSDINNDYIFVHEKKAFSTSGFCVREINDYDAIGAGSDFSLASLYLGHDAEEAAKVACELSIYCELPIFTYYNKW